ncbi:MAG: hypothetical protein QXF82_10415 [Nitrososphaeria archaeon]
MKRSYTTDKRIKVLFTEIGDQGKLKLRTFTKTRDEHKDWCEGGLRFGEWGSCDAAWYEVGRWKDPFTHKECNAIPRIAVEGTFGTERGHFGTAQYQRIHHVMGAVVRGIIGVYLIPKSSTYMLEGKRVHVHWLWQMVLAALNASKIHSAPFLVINANEPQILTELVKALGFDDNVRANQIVQDCLDEMKDYVEENIPKHYDLNEYLNSMDDVILLSNTAVGKILSSNLSSFVSSSKRGGHIAIGEYLVHRYAFDKKKVFLIFPRLTTGDLAKLDERRHKKEWIFLRTRNDLEIITFDDLQIKNTKLRDKLLNIREKEPLNKLPWAREWKNIVKELKSGFINGKIQIKKKSSATLKNFV